MDRRDFLKQATAAGAAGLAVTPSARGQSAPATGPVDVRARWVRQLQQLADPVLTHLSAGTLKARMPVEQAQGADRSGVTHLEALGRLLAGIAPWIELAADETGEAQLRRRYADLVRAALARAVDPGSPDFMNFVTGGQPLVDAAFLAQAVLRAPRALDEALDATVRRHLIAALNPHGRSRRRSTTGCCSPRRSKPRSAGSVPAGMRLESTTRYGSTSSGTSGTARTETGRRSTGTITTAS